MTQKFPFSQLLRQRIQIIIKFITIRAAFKGGFPHAD